ncbi:MAG: acyltransferase family protein [Clostridia bacterium]|nr:acyltransferase family protein [Clostridia bacterium]
MSNDIVKKRKQKILIALKLSLCGNGYKKAQYLKDKKIFKEFGNNNYWYPRIIPADPKKILIHNNVYVATNVYFCTHDVMHLMFQHIDKNNKYSRYTKEIEIFDNCFIGANSTIMYGVKIGPNAIVAANSVVTKDVPNGYVVGGNPARIIGKFEDVRKKRLEYEKIDGEEYMNEKRERWIDVCKGITMILVVIGHVISSYHNSGLLKEATIFNFIHAFIYYFHMPLFFFISGYLLDINKNKKDKKERITEKLISYGIPYIIFSIIYFLLKIFTSQVVNTRLSIKDILLIPIIPISFMWYLYAVMIMAILAIVFTDVKQRKVLFVISFALKFVTDILLNDASFSSSIFKELIIFDIAKNLLWYITGILFYHYKLIEKIKKIKNNNRLTCLFITLFSIISILTYVMQIKYNFVMDILLSMLGILVTLILSLKIEKNNLLEKIGKNTLPIYFLHGIIIAFLRIIMTKLKIPLLEGSIPLFFCTTLSITISLITYRICSKSYILDFIFYPKKYLKIKK